MSSWRDTIVNEFAPGVSKLTLVADPDNLFTEEKLLLELRARGFNLIDFSDPVEFRYACETGYRSLWDQGEHIDLVVTLRQQETDLQSMPYDLLQAGRLLAFNLGKLFPGMSYPVIEGLDRSLLDDLFEAQTRFPTGRMGENATSDFILRHVFSIAAELISNDADLMRALLRLHYGQTKLPHTLIERLVQELEKDNCFQTWPLDAIVPDAQAFFTFLQERWPLFLGAPDKTNQAKEASPDYALQYPGPDLLPFDHKDVRIYIDNLFVEGKLTPVQLPGLAATTSSWARCGIAKTNADDHEARISRLFELVGNSLPTEESRYSGWTDFALKWAELSALVHCSNSLDHKSRLSRVSDELNTVFIRWLRKHYASLIHMPPTNPAMLHHVPRRMAREMEDLNSTRLALIVVDGLALDQWVTVRQLLHNDGLLMREYATFAWIPTLTSVSRQSIFSGKPPIYFPASIHSTNSEKKLWEQFWEDHGLARLDIVYERGLGSADLQGELEEKIHSHKTRVAGLVVDTVDKIMHGMQLGSAGMHNQTKQWCQKGFLSGLIEYLLDCEYRVWLTSDHGNIECAGKGRPSEGVIAETRGERVRVYPTPELRSQVASRFTFAHEWQPVGLPPEYFPLVTGNRDAFVKLGDSIVGHGGIAIEEVIVPLVEFERKQR